MPVTRWISATAVALAVGFLSSAAPVVAHHASTPFYDTSRKVEAQGTVTKFVFRNPHAFLYFESIDEKGQKITWQVELGGAVSLTRTGWTPQTLEAGTMIKVVGQPSRAEGSHGICCARITRPDGSPIVAGGRVQEEAAK